MNPITTLEEIYLPIEARLDAVGGTVLKILSPPQGLATEVITHFFSAKGKLLRPALTFLGADLAGVLERDHDRLQLLAASLEIFHSATLIHDDIIDSAYMRRNLQTIHEKWSPQVAVLTGDYLHDKALRTLFNLGHTEIFRTFLKTAGEVCSGEMRELTERRNFNLTEADYMAIISDKTASLLSCALTCGAMLGGGDGELIRSLERFGRYFGSAFQIIDDCLDFTGDENEFGKTLGADCSIGVLTLPLIHLLSAANASDRRRSESILSSEFSPEDLKELSRLLAVYGSVDYALKQAAEYRLKAGAELEGLKDSAAKRSLEQLLDYILKRDH